MGTVDEDAFRDFAVASGPALFRSAVLLTGDWHLAEDLVQDTLARMYRAWPGIGRIDNPAAYAQTVLTRRFLSVRRRRSSGERPSAVVPDLPAHGVDAALRVTLLAALATLPKRDRAVVVLRYLLDRSVAEVAADLGRSESAVKVQAHRALARLRAALADDHTDIVQH